MTRTKYDITWAKNLAVDEKDPDHEGVLKITRIPLSIRNYGLSYRSVPEKAHWNYFNKAVSEDLNRPYSCTIDELPAANPDNENLLMFVTDDRDGKVLAASDGTNWRRTKDNTIVSKT